MIDRPQGKFDRWFDDFANGLNEIADDTFEAFAAGWNEFKRLRKEKTLVFCASIAIFITVMYFAIASIEPMVKTVVVEIDFQDKKYDVSFETYADTYGEFLDETYIGYIEGRDLINVKRYEKLAQRNRITVTKTIVGFVKVDGEIYEYAAIPPFTVGEMIDSLAIELHELDVVSEELDSIVEADQEISITRIEMEYLKETVETKFETKYVADSGMTIGTIEVKKKGRKGIVENTYIVVYEDGEVVSKIQTNSEVIQKKRDKVINYGTHILKGVPSGLKYKEKIEHVRAVSYWYPTQRIGVYGEKCAYGTCAVDKTVIPLGSKLYIEGYGYAIANDVGSAIKGKTVDLYMSRLGQCGIWGARWTNVYILEYGDNKRFWER